MSRTNVIFNKVKNNIKKSAKENKEDKAIKSKRQFTLTDAFNDARNKVLNRMFIDPTSDDYKANENEYVLQFLTQTEISIKASSVEEAYRIVKEMVYMHPEFENEPVPYLYLDDINNVYRIDDNGDYVLVHEN